jgi:hypothetical protein
MAHVTAGKEEGNEWDQGDVIWCGTQCALIDIFTTAILHKQYIQTDI